MYVGLSPKNPACVTSWGFGVPGQGGAQFANHRLVAGRPAGVGISRPGGAQRGPAGEAAGHVAALALAAINDVAQVVPLGHAVSSALSAQTGQRPA